MIRTNLNCHNCGGYFNVDFNDDLNGRHIVNCPRCNHEHCRVIVNGEVSEDRWDSRNPQGVFGATQSYSYTGYAYTTSATNYSTAYTGASYYTWASSATNSTGGY